MSQTPAFSDQRRQLLEGLLSGEGVRHRRPDDAVETRPAAHPAPLSAEQRHVWLHASMASDQPLYNEAITIHRRGSFDLAVLERALNEFLRRHEIWRTSIERVDGVLRLIAHPDARLDLRLEDVSGVPPAEREDAARRIAEEEARKPFDLTEAPLLRAIVVRMAEDEHRLYLTLHHIIFDGVTIYRVLVPELAEIYAAYSRGEDPDLPEPRLQYADYAAWRERRLEGEGLSRELDYWRGKLSGDLPELNIPADRNRPAVMTHRGSMETFELSAEFTASLKEFSLREGVTPYVTLLAAFKAMLHRYSGQDDMVIGGVTDMRRRPELEGVIGYFLNSLALRTQPTGETSFRDYLGQVRSTVVEALDASNVPFDQVVRAVRPRRDGARHPLFQVLFSIEPPAPAFPQGWDLTQMDVVVGTAKFDLYLELDEHHDRLIGRFLYSTDLFEAATIRRMIGHWRTLLEGAVRDPDCVLAKLPLLTAEERRELLIEQNRTARAYPQTTIRALFAAQARRAPDAVAVQCDGRQWTYGELDRRASDLARELRCAGAGKGVLVAVAMERSLEMVAGLLAVLETGSAYLPLDPELPRARLVWLLDDARPAVVLADEAARSKLPALGARIVPVDGQAAGVDDPSGVAGDSDDVAPDDLAYVLYTSGSTGRPKAVEIRHRSLVNLLTSVEGEIGFTSGDALLAVTTLSFDIAALEIFLPLLAGARLVVAGRQDASDPMRLAALIDRSGCTVMQATPATWRSLVATGWSGSGRLKILCGGEALSGDLAAALLDRGSAVWNLYGPTETTIWSLRHRVSPKDDPAPIGRPLANTQAYILDRNGEPVPCLAAGELMIGGDGLACGYRGDPELTAEKFARFDSVGGLKLYRTGDIARRRGDGAIEFLGRTDNQVKIRGYRVGLEEVESAIAGVAGVAGCAVRTQPDGSGEASLTAYLAGGDFDEDEVSRLRKALGERLPSYMIPSRFVRLPALPLTKNGKIDRSRLPEPELVGQAGPLAPRNDIEARLIDLWKEVLGLPAVGVEDNFFDLGGHSLLAAILVAKIQAAFDRELPLVALFQSPTVASLAAALGSMREPEFSHLVPLRPGSGRPLFIVHGIFGNVIQLKDLAERLTTSRAIYALQARGVDLRLEPHSNIAEMIEAYAAAIRSVQPAGPYALAGHSFGGLVAFEIARRLRASGEQVEFVALLETDVHEHCLPLPDKLAYATVLARRVGGKLGSMPVRAAPAYLMSKLRQLWGRFLPRTRVRDDFVWLQSLSGPMAERSLLMHRIGMREFRRFNPGRYDGKLSVFRTRGPRFEVCDALPIWRRAARSVEVFEIDGEHFRFMEMPCIADLAAQLSRCLAASDLVATPVDLVADAMTAAPSFGVPG